MAFGTAHIIKTDYDGSTVSDSPFIPELWSDEVVAAYKTNLVMANLVARMNHVGKKGAVVHLPSPSRGSASDKAAETIVTFNNPAASVIDVTINKHKEYSYLFEDLTDVQALPSLRKFLTDDAGYAIAKQIDQDLFVGFATAQGGAQYSGAVIGGDGTTAWDGTANTNTGNASALTDVGIRTLIQTLDDTDTPMTQRAIVVPPVERNNLMGIPRFTEQAFTGEASQGNTIRNGHIGDVYGIPVYVTTNCPFAHLDSGDGDDYFDFSNTAATTGTDATGASVTIGAGGVTAGRVGVLCHKDSIVFAEQMSVRTQMQYKQEYLSDLFTADTIYGVAEIRDTASIPFIVAD